jgi:hypothetical protein
MKRHVLLIAALLAAGTAHAQRVGSITFVVASGPQQQIENLDSATLAVEVRQRLDRGALSGTTVPLVLDGKLHERRMRLGGEPAVLVGRHLSRTVVQGLERDVTISYGPARQGGIGVHAEVADGALTPGLDGGVERTDGRRSEITGVVPSDGRPQAVMTRPEVAPGSVVLPNALIVLVEP